MQAIADRSNSSIGALYNYFPDKQSIAVTLLSRYAEELQWRLKSLMEHSEKLSTAQFAGLFIDCIIEFAQERPAYLNLHTAPIRFRRDPAARKALRTIVANAFRTKNPSLSSEQSLLAANVAVQIVKSMIFFSGIRRENQTAGGGRVSPGAYLVSGRGFGRYLNARMNGTNEPIDAQFIFASPTDKSDR
jgi:AcrR family transcriptional regulator